VDFKKAPEILRISLKGERPDEMVVLVDAVVKAYLDELFNHEVALRKALLRKLEEQQGGDKKILAEKRKVLAAIAIKLGGDLNIAKLMHEYKAKRKGDAEEELKSLGGEKRKLERQLITKESEIKGIAKAHFPPDPADLERDLVVKRHVTDIAQLDVTINEIRTSTASSGSSRTTCVTWSAAGSGWTCGSSWPWP
jgi:hypothetical protein